MQPLVLRTELAPTYNTFLGNCSLIWFQKSNQYILLDSKLSNVVFDYLNAPDLKSFEHKIGKYVDLSEPILKDIAEQVELLLIDSNRLQIDSANRSSNISNLPKTKIQSSYQFKNKVFSIGVSSIWLKQLIHPQLSHLEITDPHKIGRDFEVIEKDETLFLIENSALVAQYSLKQSHFLEGTLGLKILNYIHDKKEQEWLATFHASTIANGKEAIMIVGESGSGKSTLTAILMQAGFDLLADDFSPMLKSDTELYRYPNAISVKEGAYETLNKLIPNFHTLPEVKSYSKNVRSKFVTPKFKFNQNHFPCNKIVLVKYDAHKSDAFKVSKPETVLSELILDSWINPDPRCAKLFMDWLGGVDYYHLSYRTNEFAINSIRSLYKC